MSPQVVRWIVAVVLIGHGIGHALAVFPLAGIPLSRTHSTSSWLLDGVSGPTLAPGLCVVLNLVALLAFVGAGLGVGEWGVPRGLWERLAILASACSLLGLFLFWNAFPFFFPNKVGVLLVDLCVLASVLWLRWPGGLFGV